MGIAKELEEMARSDSYFVDRNLYPNVDFYSGILLKALNIQLICSQYYLQLDVSPMDC